MHTMSNIKSHADRSRGPAARAASKARRAQRIERERIATNAERAFLAIVAPKAAR